MYRSLVFFLRTARLKLLFLACALLAAGCSNGSDDPQDHPHRHGGGGGQRGRETETEVETVTSPTPSPSPASKTRDPFAPLN